LKFHRAEGGLSHLYFGRRFNRIEPVAGHNPLVGRVALATLDGKAYYQATRLLREVGIPFQSMVPGKSRIERNTLVLTTRREKGVIRGGSVVAIEDLGSDLTQARQYLLRMIFGGKNHELLVGVDPGKMVGVAAFYQGHPLEWGMFEDWREAVSLIQALVSTSPAEIRKVRVGNGDKAMASKILRELSLVLRGKATVEEVDESGTSKSQQFRRAKLSKDLRAAAVIAFREGRPVW
jgi:hypothetical protein